MSGPWRLFAVLATLLASSGVLVAQTSKAARMQNPHGPLAIACENCHTTTSWAPIRKTVEFDHNRETKYPLRGLHQNVACNSCHLRKVFTNVGHQCADCHADIHRRQLGARCQDCHTVNGWRANVNAIRSHLNRFPLLGAHATVECDSCHPGAATGVYVGLSTDCISCHQRNFQQARPLDHVAANLPVNCLTCHTMDQWQGAKFDHTQFTRFSLTGAHAQLACTSCHAGNRFQGTPTECYGCHAQTFAATKNPNHVTAGFPHDCSGCHNTSTWQGATFDHNTTKFRLTGAHISVLCSACHVNGRFAGTPTDCAGCHLPDFAKTTNPNHRSLNLPTQCDTCHTTANWQGAKFDHSITKFPLTGAHATAACAQCHAGGQFTAISTDCVSCHLTDFKKTTSPSHVTTGFPTTCADCHTTSSWAGAQFDHSKTIFPLNGAHTTLTCSQCHTSKSSGGSLPTDCVGCHMQDYKNTTQPNHVAMGQPTTCQWCHTTAQWSAVTFNHTTTGFALTGFHATIACTQCHVNNNYKLTAATCIGCHQKDFASTNNPPHAAAAFPTTCEVCHNTASWANAVFNHSTATKFPLTGAHVSLACSQCHVGGKFAGTPTDCAGCHLTDFNKTTNPSHVAAGFPTLCSACHTTASWAGAQFDHSKTAFPLTGAHQTTACNQCHVGGNFSSLSTACASCHLKDFQGTTNPNHVSAGFPTDCSVCHTTTNWLGATFNHTTTGFALTGAHVNLQCAQCHTNNNFNLTSAACINCHLTDYNGTNNPPHKSAGFPQDCTLCHTTTNWLGATFNWSTWWASARTSFSGC